MGELSLADANSKREKYKEVFVEIKSMVEKEFSDMDFENADKHREMAEHIEAIKTECDNRIKELDAMLFA